MVSDAMKHFAKRVKSDPFFLAHNLPESIPGVDEDTYVRLCLCGAPRNIPEAIAIGAHFGFASDSDLVTVLIDSI
jgi:hypothetical protein